MKRWRSVLLMLGAALLFAVCLSLVRGPEGESPVRSELAPMPAAVLLQSRAIPAETLVPAAPLR